MPGKFLKRSLFGLRSFKGLSRSRFSKASVMLPTLDKNTQVFLVSKQYSTQPKWIVSSNYSDVDVPNIPFTEFIFNKQEKYGGRIALRSAETNINFTHAQVRETSLRIASAFHKLGVSKGDVVAIFSPNCPEFLLSFVGAAHIGATITTVNSTYTSEEISKQLQDSSATVVVGHFLLYAELKKALKNCPKVQNVILIGKEEEGTINFNKLMSDDGSAVPQRIEINPAEDLLVLPYSSGTTGLPKGVMLTHTNIIANIQQLLHPDLLRVPRNPDGEFHPEKFLGIIPLFHIYGMVSCMLMSLAIGAEMVTLFRFDPQQYISTIKKHKPSILHVVPPIVAFLTFDPRVEPDLLKDVKFACCGAAPVGINLLDKFLHKFKGVDFLEGYGMTEASPVTHMTPKYDFIKGSCGTVIANTLSKIVDVSTQRVLGPNDGPGELCVKGPQVMKGYYNNPEATKETISKDGWLHTGDIATIDENKNVFIVDRLKELIKVKGFQVAPAELEDILLEHPHISDAAVIGVPDKRSGELPKAFVVPMKEAKIDPQEIEAFVKSRVAPHKELGGGVAVVSHIPKSESGKILRRKLK